MAERSLRHIEYGFCQTDKGPVFEEYTVGESRTLPDGADRTVKKMSSGVDKNGHYVKVMFVEDDSFDIIRNVYREFWSSKIITNN